MKDDLQKILAALILIQMRILEVITSFASRTRTHNQICNRNNVRAKKFTEC